MGLRVVTRESDRRGGVVYGLLAVSVRSLRFGVSRIAVGRGIRGFEFRRSQQTSVDVLCASFPAVVTTIWFFGYASQRQHKSSININSRVEFCSSRHRRYCDTTADAAWLWPKTGSGMGQRN